MRIQISLMGLMVLALAACSHNTSVVSADQHAVTVRYRGSGMEDATEKANHYCRQFHERAQLSSTQAEADGYTQATYACVPR